MLNFENWFDEHGFLCMINRDGGDSAQKTGLYRFARWLKYYNDPDQISREEAKFEQELDGFEDPNKKNNYRRHPDKNMWYSRSNNFSRDQQRSLVMAIGALKRKKRLLGILWEHVKRFGFYQNNRKHDDPNTFNFPDFIGPGHAGEYIRALFQAGYKYIAILWPLLIFTDLCELFALLYDFYKWKNPEESDDDNLIMSLLQAKFALPTPFSWLHRKLYKKYRPRTGLFRVVTDDMSGPETAIAYKHRLDTGAPPFILLYGPILKEHL